MKKILIILLCVPFLAITQNSHTINIVGNTFSPSSLTITVGDDVTWNNTSGNHNVNGTQATYPNNPDDFGNAVAPAPWIFSHTFTIPGTYEYQCDPHVGMGMAGTIVVAPECPIVLVPESTPGACDGYIDFDPVLLATLGCPAPITYTWGSTTGTGYCSGLTYNISLQAIDVNNTLCCQYSDTALLFPIMSISGCTDSTADNYDPLATVDDGSCIYCSSLSATVTSSDVTCFGGSDGQITISASGGVGPYTYEVTEVASLLTVCLFTVFQSVDCVGLLPNNYVVVVTDSVGCVFTTSVTVTEPSELIANAIITDVSCPGLCDGSVEVFPSGGCAPYSFLWSSGIQTQIQTGLCEGQSVAFAITDCNNCVISEIVGPIGSLGLSGCTDVAACNYDASATCDDGSCLIAGCMDSTAFNYDPLAACDDGSCMPPAQDLFFSEYGEGSGSNRYLEIYNPTLDTIDLTNYALGRVGGTPDNGVGIYDDWVDFDSGAVIFPNDVYIVAHSSADPLILAETDMTYNFLSNGDDGMALVYGTEPLTPTHPDSGFYQVLDWIGDWNGDPGQGWEVAGVNNATRNHTLVRKCDVIQGDTSWTNSSGTNAVNSQWIVLGNNDWSDIGQYIISPCNLIYGCTDSLACNYDSTASIDDGSCVYPGQTFQSSITICDGDSITVGSSVYHTTGVFSDTLVSSLGCDSIIQTNLTIFSQALLYDTVFGGIPDTSVGGGNFYSGSQYLELSCYESSDLISALIFSQDTTLTTFEISDAFGNVLDDVTVTVIPGGHRVYFNYHLLAGVDYRLGVSGQSNNLFRHNSGVNYPYNFGSLAALTSSSAGGNYYYFYYDIELRQSPSLYNLCDGDSITIAGSAYSTTGLYIDSLISSLGCDSLVYSNVVVSPHVSYINNQTICSGETYLINGNVYDSTGTYIDSLQTSFGCDSIVTTHLNVDTISGGSGINNFTICIGDSIVVGSSVYYHNGVYNDTLVASNGCDSILTTYLTVNTANYTAIFGGISDTTIGGGGFFSGSQYLELSCYESSMLVSAVVYAQDTTLTVFEIRDDNGNVLSDTTYQLIPGGNRIYFNYEMTAGLDYELGINGNADNLYRNNAGVNYSYDFGTAASITSSSAGGNYYYFFYDVEVLPYLYEYNEKYICYGDSIIVGGNTYNTPGQYLDNFVSFGSCDSVVFTVLDFYESPSLFIQSVPDPAEICLGDSVVLEGSQGFVYYWWDNGLLNDRLVDFPTEDTWYLLSAKDSNDCVVKEDIWVYVDSCITGLNDELSLNINIYPNPSNGLFVVEFREVKENNLAIRIINSIGDVIFFEELKVGDRSKKVNISDLSKGIYFVELQTDDGVINKKLILQ